MTDILVGLIGAGIQASRTPAMHEKEGAEQGLRYVYRLIDLETLNLGAEALPKLMDAAEREGFSGLNITHPCKQSVIPLLIDLSDDARALGAVNTVVLRDGTRFGHNTDWWGFAESFRRGLPHAALGRVVQLGAGGGGAAVSHAALTLGVEQLTLFDLAPGRAQSLATALGARFGKGRAVAGTDVRKAMASGRTDPRNAYGHGEVSWSASACGVVASPALGCGNRLFPVGNRVAEGRESAGLQNIERRGDGGVPSGRSIPVVHGHHARRRQDATAFRVDGSTLASGGNELTSAQQSRPPLPPFTRETAVQKARMAEDAWNSRDPERVSLAYTVDSTWRNRAEFLSGRPAIVQFLQRKWAKELDYRLIKEIWAFHEERIAVRFAYEWHDDSGSWFRSYGNENWEFDEFGLMRRRIASINDLPIKESERKYHWPLGRRPDDHPGLSELGL